MVSFIQESDNPFGLTNVGDVSKPTFADIDGDGDLDAFIEDKTVVEDSFDVFNADW